MPEVDKRTLSPARAQALDTLETIGPATAREVADEASPPLHFETARSALQWLRQRDLVATAGTAEGDGRALVYTCE